MEKITKEQCEVAKDSGEDNITGGYVEYLFKNYHTIKRELQQLKLELEYYDETQPGGSIQNKGNNGGIAVVLFNVSKRMESTSKEKLASMVKAGELEIKKLHSAIEALDKTVGGVISDIYIDRLSWGQICSRRYISPNTLNRYKKRGLEEITKAFFVSQPFMVPAANE
ncbi:MAG: hypothetical protein Q8O09_04745 [Bacillota bacterium]|nr:hypothetical protein [Bacillota bacterium]